MHALDLKVHWENVYAAKDDTEVSWFEESPEASLDLIAATGATATAAVIDMGGGASHLADALLDRGFVDVTVLDLAEGALAKTKARLGGRASRVHWIVADATTWDPPPRRFDVWHDRAVFHFLTTAPDRAAYVERLERGLRPGGHAIFGTFAPDGPERCSGLPVARYDAAALASVLPPSFALVSTRPQEHRTPGGSVQKFQFSTFRKAR